MIMLTKLPIEREVYIDATKISSIDNRSEVQVIFVVIDGVQFEFYGDDYPRMCVFFLTLANHLAGIN